MHKFLPFINHLYDVSGLVDLTIVHNYDGIWTRKHIHLIEEATDEFFEPCCGIGSFYNIQGDDSIKSQCRED